MTDLERAVELIKAGDKSEGGRILSDLVRQDPSNELAWLWLSTCVKPVEQKKHCLEQVLRINPQNAQARAGLEKLNVSVPSLDQIVDQQSSKIASSAAVVRTAGPDSIGVIMIVLLIILGIFWIGIGLSQIFLGQASDTPGSLSCTGTFNIAISFVNLLGIADIVKRSQRVPKEMMFLAVVGCLLGGFQLLNGAYLQACAIPLYVVLGVLANVSKNTYIRPVQEVAG